MKFKTTEDVDAPPGPVWERFIDFDLLEAESRERGAEITRIGNWSDPQEGAAWRGVVSVRGKRRPFEATITRFSPNEAYSVDSRIGGMDCHVALDFVALSPEATRVGMVLELSADTLAARLILQSLKLARGQVLQRLQGIMARQGNAAEAAYRPARS